jgi:hypothetical protein
MPILKPTRGIQINKSHPLARGLVGCWLFNEGTGQKIYNYADPRFSGMIDTGSLSWVPGSTGSAVSVTGQDDRIALANVISLGNGTTRGPYTIAFRCKMHGSGWKDQYFCGVDNNYFHFVRIRSDKISFRTESSIHDFPTAPDIFKWTMYAITHNGAGSYDRYDNGQHIDNLSGSAEYFNFIHIFAGGGDPSSGKFDGECDFILCWPNRYLTADEIAWLYREPFCMFERGLSPATLYLLSGGAVELTGSIDISTDTTVTVKVNRKILASCEGATEVTAVLKLSRSLAAALQSLANLIGSLTLVGQVQLAGSISATLSLTAKLSLVTAGKWFTRLLEAERQWLINTLFAGMTANAIKLGTVLSNGWFWMRRLECSVLYRGLSMDTVDFANILTVAENNDNAISPPDYISHNAGSSYLYVVRRFNSCGYQEYTLSAAVKVAIDINGNLIKPQPNKLLTCVVSQISGNKVQLLWFYCPIKQKSQPTRFNIYCDNKTGQIDYQEPLTAISYQGRRFYNFDSDMLETGKYLFAIRPTDAEQVENDSLAQKGIQIDATGPDAIDILNAETE